MKFEKNYANISISEITNTKYGVLNRKNTGVVEIMILEACDRCIQSKIKWQLTRALIAYPSPVSTEPDGFEEFVSEIEKGKIEKLSKKKSNDKTLDETEQLIYHSIHVLYCQLIRYSLFYVLKRFIQAQLNLTYNEEEPDYKKILTDNWKKISFTNLKKSLIVHISKQKSFLPLRIPKYYKSKSSPKLPNASLHKKKSGPLKTGHHLPTLTINTSTDMSDQETLNFQNDRMTLPTTSAPESEQISPMNNNYTNQIYKTSNEKDTNNLNEELMNNNETLNKDSPRVLSEQEQLILRKTPSLDLLKKSPYLLLRLLGCMKPTPSLENYPREKKLIENIIETVKQEEKLNADIISESDNSLSKLDDETRSSENLDSSSNEEMISKFQNENLTNPTQSIYSTNSDKGKTKEDHPISTVSEGNSKVINNAKNININEACSSSSTSTSKPIFNKPVNLLEELNFLNELNNKNITSSIMNDISIQNPNNLINSIILKNFEATGKNSYKKVPHYVTTIEPNPNTDNNKNNNNNDKLKSSTTNTTTNNEKSSIKTTKSITGKPEEASIDHNVNNTKHAETKLSPKNYLDLSTVDLKNNASVGYRFDQLIDTNTLKNAHIIQKVNMNLTIKKESLHNKTFDLKSKKEEQSKRSSNIVIQKEAVTKLNQHSILSSKIKEELNSAKNDHQSNIETATKTSINLRDTDYDATTSIINATLYESGNKMVAKNDCHLSEDLQKLTNNNKSSPMNSNMVTSTMTSTEPEIATNKIQNESKVSNKKFSIYDQPHRRRYSKNNSHSDNKGKQSNNNTESFGNNNSNSNSKKLKNKKKEKHFIPVNREDIINDGKTRSNHPIKDGKVKLNSNNKSGNNEKTDDNSSNLSASMKSQLEHSYGNSSSNGNSNSNSPSIISSITPTTSVTTSIINKGKNRVHHRLLYSKEPTPAHPDNFYEDNGRENDYYHLSHSRNSSFYDDKNISENGFQTPSSSPTNPLKKLN